MKKARDLVVSRLEVDENLRTKLRWAYGLLYQAITSLGAQELTIKFDSVWEAEVISNILEEEFGFSQCYHSKDLPAERTFALLYYRIVHGTSPFAKFFIR